MPNLYIKSALSFVLAIHKDLPVVRTRVSVMGVLCTVDFIITFQYNVSNIKG